MKECPKCHIEKDRSEFWKELKNKNGLKGSCRSCAKQYKQEIIAKGMCVSHPSRRAAANRTKCQVCLDSGNKRTANRKATMTINWRGKKTCVRCERTLPRKRFNIDYSNSDLLKLDCKDCEHYWRSYRINYYDRQLLYKVQGGKCAVCGEPKDMSEMNVDHKHREGYPSNRCEREDVRGLVCSNCNNRVIAGIESPYFAEALEYLAFPPAVQILNSNDNSSPVESYGSTAVF